MILIRVDRVSYSVLLKNSDYADDNVKHILKNISFQIEEAEIIGIAGESGGGKTTLARIVAGILPPVKGDVLMHKAMETKNNKCSPVQILFQNSIEILNPYRRVVDMVDEAIIQSGVVGYEIVMEREKIFNALQLEGNLVFKRGYQLSGGEQQRAALARLLGAKPKLLILDEPFSAQDIKSQLNFVDVIKNINEELGTAVLCISHDLKLLKNLAGRFLIIKDGEIVEDGSADKIFNNPSHPYTKFLLRAEDYSLTFDEISENLKD